MEKMTCPILLYVVYTNTDLTEGRGREVPVDWSHSKATAKRLAKGSGVQGSDAEVRKVPAFYVDKVLYGPVDVEIPTAEDVQIDRKEEETRAALDRRVLILQQAGDAIKRDLGISQKEELQKMIEELTRARDKI
jgi:hypothetical protein